MTTFGHIAGEALIHYEGARKEHPNIHISLILFLKLQHFQRWNVHLKTWKNSRHKVIYTGTRLSTYFNVKDEELKDHKHNIAYKFQWKNQDCDATYIGDIKRLEDLQSGEKKLWKRWQIACATTLLRDWP